VFDSYKGVIIYVRVINGKIEPDMFVMLMNSGKKYEVLETGAFTPSPQKVDSLSCGEVGYICCNIKDPADVLIGDTVTDFKSPAEKPLHGFKKNLPLVYSGLYPVNSKDFDHLRDCLHKLKLTDFGFVFETESSPSLGFGFRCGFLGLLHMDIVQERLEREFELNIIATTPSVVYRIKLTNGTTIEVDNPAKFPEPQQIDFIEEPYIRAFMIVPHDCLGPVMSLAQSKRGIHKSKEFLDEQRMMLTYEFPLAEIIVDFYDKLKSVSSGFASMNYEVFEYRLAEIVRMDILVAEEVVPAFSRIVARRRVQEEAEKSVEKLYKVLPRQMFVTKIQAKVGG